MFLCLSTGISVAKSIPKSKRLQGLPSINFSPKTLAMPSDYSTGLEGHFAIFLLPPFRVAQSAMMLRRRCGRGLFCQSVPKPHIYFKQGGASNWSLAAP